MDLQFLDMPYIFRQTQDGFDFIYALTECKDLELFNLKSIQVLIDTHAAYWDRINHIYVGIPMTIQLILYWYWSNIVLPNMKIERDTFESQNSVL